MGFDTWGPVTVLAVVCAFTALVCGGVGVIVDKVDYDAYVTSVTVLAGAFGVGRGLSFIGERPAKK